MTSVPIARWFRNRRVLPAVAAILALGLAPAEPGTILESTESYSTRGQEIVVDVVTPSAPGRYPAVVVLHGNGGIGDGKRSGFHHLARVLARSGYVALVPHYFGRQKPDARNGRKNARSFDTWTRTVSAAVSHAARRPDVDPQRIGLVGSSLGSSVALSVAARDRRVSAVVENCGGLLPWETLQARRLPPVLILHGDADTIVSVDEAYKLDHILEQAGVLHDIHIYPGAGHSFQGADRDDADQRTVAFFDRYLKRMPPEDGKGAGNG
jgi:carboxymethylenebutenolidase